MPEHSPLLSHPRAIVLDLDGTIADSFDIFLETLESVIHRPQPLTKPEISRLRGYTLPDMINELGVKKWQLPRLVMKGRRQIAAKMDQVNAFEGMPDLIKQLSAEDYGLYILSTNAEAAITAFLGRYGLQSCINDIYADVGLMGKAKSLRKLQKRERLLPEDCIYVGDETRDIEAARKAGVRCVAVTWGYSNATALAAHHPTALVDTSEALLRAIKQL
jgi:phosphoglycolate phosphatase